MGIEKSKKKAKSRAICLGKIAKALQEEKDKLSDNESGSDSEEQGEEEGSDDDDEEIVEHNGPQDED